MEGKIGRLLARFPRNNELWPSVEVAEVLDSLDSETAVSHFETEIFNSRGTTVRNPYDGGSQERDLGAYFKRMSDALIGRFPVTAGALLRVAKSYARDAVREDESARMDELR